MSKKKTKVTVVRDIITIVLASALIPCAIMLACNGSYECAMLALIYVRITLIDMG